MNNIIGFIDYNEDFSIWQRSISKIYFKINIKQINKDSFKIIINQKSLNKRKIQKLVTSLKKQTINTIACSVNLKKIENDFKKHGFKVLSGKDVMKVLSKDILSYIFKAKQSEMQLEDLYITVSNDKYYHLITDLAENFKSINVVTNCLRKLKRLEKKLDNNTSVVYSISGNKKKSLKRAKLILNLDYDDDFFCNFSYNRKAIVINLNEKLLNLRRGYQGIIIEKISIFSINQFPKKQELKNFSDIVLCEAMILNKDYYEARNILSKHECVIENLIGKNGVIDAKELKNNKS